MTLLEHRPLFHYHISMETEKKESLSDCNIYSPTEIKRLLSSRSAAPRKRWGQNFLISEEASARIVAAADIKTGERIWEVGPGLGSLTRIIGKYDPELTLFEIDPVYCDLQEQALGESGRNFQLIRGDFLKTYREMALHQPPDAIIGCLPYNVASMIIGNLIEKNTLPQRIIITVQKELAERMTAKPRNKNYSSFTLLCSFAYDIKKLFNLPPSLFYPRPGVTSQTVQMVRHDRYRDLPQRDTFFKVCRILFGTRRKTIHNSIKGTFLEEKEDIFRECGIDVGRRAEELTIEEFVAVAVRAY